MDPSACVTRILDATPKDLDEFLEACEALAGWLVGGGWTPRNIGEIPEEYLLLLHMHNRDQAKVIRTAKERLV